MPPKRPLAVPACLAAGLALAAACKPKIVVETEVPEPPKVMSGEADPDAEREAEREAVRTAVRAYADALSSRDTRAAATWVVPETFVFYEDLRQAALYSTRAQLENWPLLTVVMILEVRLRIPAAELQALDGRALFEHGIRDGSAHLGVHQVDLGEVWLGEGEARGRAEIRADGAAVFVLRESEEGGRWLIDLPALVERMLPEFDDLLKDRVEVNGKLGTALDFLELQLDHPIDPTILDGPPVAR